MKTQHDAMKHTHTL